MTNSQDKSSKPSDPTMNPSSPYFLHPTDTGLKLVSTVFTGVGFKSWKRAISIGLSGKNKMGFVDGTIKRSTTSNSHGRAWDRVNDVVLGWLLNAVDERIYQSVLWFKTAKEVWDNLEQRFGQSSSAQLFTVYEAISKATQTPNMSIEEFFTKMKSLWDEIDALDPVAACSCTGCTCEYSQKTAKSEQGRRLIQFLMKLDARYQHTRSNILMMKEMPTVCETYRILTQEQTHQEISRASYVDTQETTIACRTEKRKYVENKSKSSRNKKANNQFFCEHCKIHGHNIEKCWKIHGYPSNFKNNTWEKNDATTSKANTALNENPNQEPNIVETRFTKEQYDQILALLKKPSMNDNKDSSTINTAHIAGIFDEEAFASW